MRMNESPAVPLITVSAVILWAVFLLAFIATWVLWLLHHLYLAAPMSMTTIALGVIAAVVTVRAWMIRLSTLVKVAGGLHLHSGVSNAETRPRRVHD